MANHQDCPDLAAELKKTKEELKDAREKIRNAGERCKRLYFDALKEMNRGNVPQGRYAFLKGQAETSARFAAALGYHLLSEPESAFSFRAFRRFIRRY